MAKDYLIQLHALRMTDIGRVGGKNASLGDMIGEHAPLGIRVPGGFATTAEAFRDCLAANGLDERIERALTKLDVGDVQGPSDRMKERIKLSEAIRMLWMADIYVFGGRFKCRRCGHHLILMPMQSKNTVPSR